jgi:pantoate kinase
MGVVVKKNSSFKSYVKTQMVSQREEDIPITPITMATPDSLDDETTTTTSHKSKRSFKEFLHIPELRVFISRSSSSKKPKK